MYFHDVNAQLILVIQWSVHLLYNFEYGQAILFKQILVGVVMGSKSFKVFWEKKPMLLCTSKTTLTSFRNKGKVWFLDIFQTCTKKQKPTVLSLKQSHALFKYTTQAVLKDSITFSDNCYLQCKIRQCQQDSYGAPSITDSGSSKFLKW